MYVFFFSCVCVCGGGGGVLLLIIILALFLPHGRVGGGKKFVRAVRNRKV